jgi:predicted ArsR family transcriptional regulator
MRKRPGTPDTRRRVLELLLTRGEQTTEELASGLHLTRSSVRSHLASLQADGYIARRGLRSGKRRPSIVYGLTPTADTLFPTAYGEFAASLIGEMKNGHVQDLGDVFRRIGDKWIARDLPYVEGTSGLERLKRVREVLAVRGFMPALEQTRSGYTLREYNCPVMPLAAGHVEVCDIVHQWLTALVGAPLQRVRCLRKGDAYSDYIIPAGDRALGAQSE